MIHILNAEIYNVRVKDCHWPLLGSAGSIVTNVSHVTNKNNMLFMDRFYNSVTIFHLKNELGVLVGGTLMPSHKHYPKELGKRLTKRGQYEFRCRGGLCAIAWKDGKHIHFLSNYHDPRGASTVNMRMWDRLTQAHTNSACGSSATTTQQSTAAVRPSYAGCGTTPPRMFPGRHRQQPLRGLLHQVMCKPLLDHLCFF